MDEPIRIVLDAFTQHIPATGNWLPLMGLGGTALFGLVLLLRGAKLAPMLAALTFLGVGGIGGSFVATWLDTPSWPTMIVVGMAGFVIGLLLFRLWLAMLLAACCASAALTVYYLRILHPHMGHFTSNGLQPGEVTLPAAGAAVATPSEQLAQLWAYLGQNVSNFQTSFTAIVASAGLAGLVFGLLLPRVSRALWAATAGTLFLLMGSVALLDIVAPTALTRLSAIGPWSWAVIGLIWAGSLVYNLVACREPRPKKTAATEEKAEPAPA